MVTFDAVTIVVCFRLVKVCWFSEFEVGYLFITFGYFGLLTCVSMSWKVLNKIRHIKQDIHILLFYVMLFNCPFSYNVGFVQT